MSKDDVLSMENPDFAWDDTPAPEPQPAPAEPVTPEPVAPAPVEPPPPEPTPETNAYKALRDSERDRADALVRQAQQAAYQQGQIDAHNRLMSQQQQQQQQAEAPDPWDPAYPAWIKDQVRQEMAPQLDQIRQQAASAAWESNMSTTRALASAQGKDFDGLFAAAVEYCKGNPHAAADINNSRNPGLEIIKVGEYALFQKSQTGAAVAAAPAGITDAIRQQVLAEEAAKRAAAGLPPQMTMPRGVGSGPSGAGMSDTKPPPSEYAHQAKADPTGWAQTRASILNQ